MDVVPMRLAVLIALLAACGGPGIPGPDGGAGGGTATAGGSAAGGGAAGGAAGGTAGGTAGGSAGGTAGGTAGGSAGGGAAGGAAGGMVFADGGVYGIPVNTYPFWRERTISVLTNAVRISPADYKASLTYSAPFSPS